MEGIAYGLVVFQWIVAGEIVLNFILNLYRPRIPGEVPRPAFDSKVLSLLAAPDNLVRSINEAVNYQFGFDITSSWGYQLLLRSVAWLLGLGVVVAIAMSTMVIVEPHQQAVRLAGGALVGQADQRVHDSGIMWKLPWPFQSAQVYDVTRIRQLDLTARRRPVREDRPDVRLWSDEIQSLTEFRPFIVGATQSAFDERGEAVGDQIGLVDAEMILQYRIRRDGGLLDYLRFASDDVARRRDLTAREEAIKSLALEQVSRRLSGLSLDAVLGGHTQALADDLREQVQQRLDDHQTGVEVVAVVIPMIRPSGGSAASFEEMAISVEARRQRIAETRRSSDTLLGALVGDIEQAEAVLAAIDQANALRTDPEADPTEREVARLEAERLLREAGGAAAQEITDAERDRWVTIMEKRAQASRHRNQLAAYRAAPRLYRQREIMQLYQDYLPTVRKYLIGVDAEQVRFRARAEGTRSALRLLVLDRDRRRDSMNKAFAVIAGLVLVGLLLLFSATYTVSYNEVAIKTRFGRTSAGSVITDPGLKFKLPVFAERVTKLDTRLQILQTPLEDRPDRRRAADRPRGLPDVARRYRESRGAAAFLPGSTRRSMKPIEPCATSS